MNHQHKLYSGFLGQWQLNPESCQYDQEEIPKSGFYQISEKGDCLEFVIQWTDADDETHTVSFSGIPDGRKVPFNGGDIADELSVLAVSEKELNSYAYFKGKELLINQRQLDTSGQAMRVTQVVRLPDGGKISNVGIYQKVR